MGWDGADPLLYSPHTTISVRAGFGLDEGEGPMEEGYKAALVRFQVDQIKVTKEYQQLLGEKEAEVRAITV